MDNYARKEPKNCTISTVLINWFYTCFTIYLCDVVVDFIQHLG